MSSPPRLLPAASSFLSFFFGVHLTTTFLATITPTEGISMVPTIPHSYSTRPFILELRTHARGRGIRVGDVITYISPRDPKYMGCKRVVGMPGDYVSVISAARDDDDDDVDVDDDVHEDGGEEGAVVRAGKREGFARPTERMVRVPEGHCWVAGDNMEWSRDSRVFGALPMGLVRGRVAAVVWPPRSWKWMDRGLEEGKEGSEVVAL